MKHYIIIGETLSEAMYCFDYMRRLLQHRIDRISKLNRTIIIGEYYLHFTSDKLYFRDGHRGFHAEIVNSQYVVRQLDRYKVLARI